MQTAAKRYYSRERVRKSLIHYLFGRGVASLASFASAILLIRAFSITTYAAYTALSGLFYFITILSNGGIERVISRFLPEYRQNGAERTIRVCIRWFIFVRMGVLLCLLIPLNFWADSVFSYLSIAEAVNIMVPFCFYSLSKSVAEQYGLVLQALLYQREATIGNLIEFITRLAAIVACMVYTNELPLGDVYWIFTAACGLRILYSLIKLSKFVGKVNAKEERQSPLRLIRMGWDNYLTLLLGLPFMDGTTKLLAASFLTHFQTAVLGFSYTLSDVMMRYLPATLLLGLIEPVFVARYIENKNFENLNQMASIVLKINLFILAPITAWMAFEGAPVIGLISGDKYTTAILPITGLMIVMMINSHQLVLRLIANAVEKSRILVSSNCSVLLLFPIYLGLIFNLGLNGLISGILFLAAFRNFYTLSTLRRLGYRYRVDWRRMTRIILASVGSVLIASCFNIVVYRFNLGINELLSSLAIAFLTGILYLIILYFCKAFSPAERDLLNRFIGRRIFVW